MLAISVIEFAFCFIDKRAAKRGKRRISERRILITAFLGGAAGLLLGMKYFRHKTKHWYFWAAGWLFLILQLALLVFLAFYIV